MNELKYNFTGWCPHLYPEPWTLPEIPYFQPNSCTDLLWYPTVTSEFKYLKINLSSSLWNKLLFCHPCFYSWYQHSINQASWKPSSHPGQPPAFPFAYGVCFHTQSTPLLDTCSSSPNPSAPIQVFHIQTWKSQGLSCWFSQTIPCHAHLNTQLPESC